MKAMVALDTKVVVRLLVADEPDQVRRARELFSQSDLWLPKTVLLETEWVLRSGYGLSRPAILHALLQLLGFSRLQAEDRPAMLRALECLNLITW